MTALKAQNISVNIDGRNLLENVSLNVNWGELSVLTGPNGAGKSTLLRALNGTWPIDGGLVELEGKPITTFSRREIAQRIAVVAQENETRFPITVLEYLFAGRFASQKWFGGENDEDAAIIADAINKCGLLGFERRFMRDLSGGERQRAVLARALATGSKILLLDEPTSNLDIAHQALMFRLVKEKCKNNNFAGLIITHDLNLAAEFADQLTLLDRGVVKANGRPHDVLREDRIKEIFGVDVLLDDNPATGNRRVTPIF